jgi:hypothetical protein
MQVERRKRIRIMTLKNFGRGLLVLLLALATANVVSEMRKPRPGEFGRLAQHPADVTLKRPMNVVTEGEVLDETPSIPPAMLLNAPAEQSGAAAPPPPVSVENRGPLTIVGGADGVRIEHAAADPTPKLTGGIFRIEN